MKKPKAGYWIYFQKQKQVCCSEYCSYSVHYSCCRVCSFYYIFNNYGRNFYKRTKRYRKEYSKIFLVVMYQTSDDFLQSFARAFTKSGRKTYCIDFINVESINEL